MKIKVHNVNSHYKELVNSYSEDLLITKDINSLGFIIMKYMLGLSLALTSLMYLSFENSMIGFIIVFSFYIVFTRYSLQKMGIYIKDYDEFYNNERKDIIMLWSTMYTIIKEYLFLSYIIIFVLGYINVTHIFIYGYLFTYMIIYIYIYITQKIYNHSNSYMFLILLNETNKFISDKNYQNLINKEFNRIFNK